VNRNRKAPMTVLRERLTTQAKEIRTWLGDDTTNGQDRALEHAAFLLEVAVFLVTCVQAGTLVDIETFVKKCT